jgi:hypothetical protein
MVWRDQQASLLERGRINATANTARQIAHGLEISLSESGAR